MPGWYTVGVAESGPSKGTKPKKINRRFYNNYYWSQKMNARHRFPLHSYLTSRSA